MAGEEAFFLALASDLGATPAELGRRLWSSELTTLRARALVERAQADISRELSEREARRERERGKRHGRRR